jgi:tetratricopeptide (TPR) repeat protein
MTNRGWLKLLCGKFIACVLCLFLFLSQAYFLANPQSTAGQLSEARKLVTEGKYAEAEASVRALLARQPSPDGFDLLGYICEQQSKLDQAEEAYGQAVKLDPPRYYSKARLGIVYGKKGKSAECIVVLQKLPDDIRNNPETLFYLCRAYLESGNNLKALETAGMVEQLGEKDPGALLSVCRLLVSKDLYEQAVPMLKKTINWLPKSSEAYYSLAFALFKMRQYDEMSPYLDQAQNLDPTAPRILLLRALSLLDSGKTSAAKDYIRKAQALSPNDKFAAYLWSRVLIEDGNYPEAIKRISDLIAGGFNDPNAHLSLVTAFRRNGEFEKAVNYALHVAQIFPDNPSANLRAAVELEFLGEFQQAEEYLRKAITLGANDPEILKTAKFSLATISVKEGKDAEAVRLLQDVILINPSDVYARVELADIHYKSGQYEQALKLLQEALSFDSQNKRAHFLMGNVLTKLGKSAEAEQHFGTFQELERVAETPGAGKPSIYTQSIK